MCKWKAYPCHKHSAVPMTRQEKIGLAAFLVALGFAAVSAFALMWSAIGWFNRN